MKAGDVVAGVVGEDGASTVLMTMAFTSTCVGKATALGRFVLIDGDALSGAQMRCFQKLTLTGTDFRMRDADGTSLRLGNLAGSAHRGRTSIDLGVLGG